VGGQLDPAGALGRVGSEVGHIIGQQGAKKRVGGDGLEHLRVSNVVCPMGFRDLLISRQAQNIVL
jgi:hypothetical protein